MIHNLAAFCTFTAAALPTAASADQYLCKLNDACLTDYPTECEDVEKRLLVRTGQDAFNYNPSIDPEIREMFGNVDIIGDETIVTGDTLSPVIHLQLPKEMRQAEHLLAMASRVSEIPTDDGARLHAGGPTHYQSPVERITVPSVTLHIEDNLNAQYDVDVGVGLDLTYHGICEELL